MTHSLALKRPDAKRRAEKRARKNRPPNALALAVREFARELGRDFEALSDDARGEVFERFAAFHVLRRFHEQEVEPARIDELVRRTPSKGGIDCLVALLDGRVLEDPAQIDAALADASGFVSVSLVAIAATRANRFDGDRLEEFVDAATDALERLGDAPTPTGPALAAGLEDTATLLARLRHAASEADQKLVYSVYVYYCALAPWTAETSPTDALARGRRRMRALGYLEGEGAVLREVEVEAVDRGRLLDLMATGLPLHSATDRPADPLEVEDYEAHLPAEGLVALPAIKGVEAGFSGHVPVGAFIQLLERDDGQGMREAIFTQNVRGYQGDGGVNERIRDTLAGRDRAQFLLRNNGVTVVADEVERDEEGVRLRNFQIVNGLQTSTVIYRIRHELRGARDVHVPVKLVAASDPQMRRAIIDATNRQTPITGAALFSGSEKAITIERYFLDRMRAGGPAIVLERRPGQYARKIAAEKLSLEEALRAFAAVFLETPHIAERGFAAIAHDLDDGLLAPSLTAEPYYVAARLLHFVRDIARLRDEPRLVQVEHHAAFALRVMLAPDKPPLGEAGRMRDYCARIETRLNGPGRRELLAQKILDVTQSPRDRMRSRVQGVPQLKRTRDDVARRAADAALPKDA